MAPPGCGSDEPARPPSPPPANHTAVAPTPADASADAGATDARAPRKVFVHGAGRCGECHGKMFDEWELSAHARAATSAFYKAAVADAKDATCDRCHAPLAPHVERDDLASEGVTCDVCHTLREPKPGPDGAAFRLAIDDMVKYGPRCDLEDHNFHRMGCSPEHAEANVCGSCHWWEPRGLPVFTEFKDWRDGPAAAKGRACQSCHMPKSRAAIATGAAVRNGVPHHGLLGLASDLRKRALALDVTLRDKGPVLEVEVGLENLNAGHPVPAGLPERRLHILVMVHEAGASPVAEEWTLGRKLTDAAGAPAPFWRATKVSRDERIGPGARWTDTAEFEVRGPGRVEVEVRYLGVDPEIAKALGFHDIERTTLATTSVAFGAMTGGHRRLPRTVRVRPGLAGSTARKPSSP